MIFAVALLAATATATYHSGSGSKHTVIELAPTHHAFGHGVVHPVAVSKLLRKVAVSHDHSSDSSSSSDSDHKGYHKSSSSDSSHSSHHYGYYKSDDSSSSKSDSSSTDSSDDLYLSSDDGRSSSLSLSDYTNVKLRDFAPYRRGTSNFAKRGYATPRLGYGTRAYKVGYAW